MKIFLTGGTGFIGSRLTEFLVGSGHQVHLLVREKERQPPTETAITVSVGDPTRPGPWWQPLQQCDAAVNLAGHPIFNRWTPAVKELIRDSRVATTRNLVAALPENPPFTLVSASGVGIYGNCAERQLDETAPPGADFLARLAREWEAEAHRAEAKGARVALMRLGAVLGPDGGAMPELVRNVQQLRTGRLGSGKQWLSWIHLEDAVAGCRFLLENAGLRGAFNFTAPEPRRQADFARTLGNLLGRHKLMPAPMFALRLALGEAAELALFSQRGIPRRLTEAGFRFQHPLLESALKDVLAALR